MPELPEVETIARQLQKVLPGRVISAVEVLREKSFPSFAKATEGQAALEGKKVVKVWRRAKMIVIELADPARHHPRKPSVTSEESLAMIIHLKMTGQLIFTPEVKAAHTSGVEVKRIYGGHPTEDWVNSLPSKHTRVIVRYSDGSTLYFNDMRVFGWMKVIKMTDYRSLITGLPPDVVDPEYTVDYLKSVLKKANKNVKLVLLDQDKIGGLGNIYTNDALYLAHTKPTRKAATLKDREIGRLHRASIQVINRGIKTGGASQSTYKHINGLGGKYQEEYLIYKREGQVCGLNGCRGVIEKIKLGGRGTYYCPVCQK